MQRIHDIYRPTDERAHDWREVERMLTEDELKAQTTRCMNCGQPFCHAYGCPLGNRVPDQNRAVAQGNWRRAYELQPQGGMRKALSPEGRPMKFHSVPNSKEVIKADLVFLAMGFTGVPADNPIVKQLKLAQTPRTALVQDSSRNIYCAGDCASGASLVVRALASGKNIPLN